MHLFEVKIKINWKSKQRTFIKLINDRVRGEKKISSDAEMLNRYLRKENGVGGLMSDEKARLWRVKRSEKWIDFYQGARSLLVHW